MRRILPILCYLLAALPAVCAPLKIVTWNLQWYPGRGPEPTAEAEQKQISAAKEMLRAIDPDIVFLQEVRNWDAAVDLCSVVPGLRVCVVSNFDSRPQNLVIASKFPADSTWYAEWKHDDKGMPPRGYAFAALRLPDGNCLLTYSVHFKSNTGGVEPNIPVREETSAQLIAHINDMRKIYGARSVLIGGDFNSSMDDPAFRSESTLRRIRGSGLKWIYEGIPASDRVTIPASGKYPDNCFDHVFYSPDLKLTGLKIVSTPGASDHNPVAIRLEN